MRIRLLYPAFWLRWWISGAGASRSLSLSTMSAPQNWYPFWQTAPSKNLSSTFRDRCANSCNRWGQTYILEALMAYVPQDAAEALLLAERIAPRLSHQNSAVVLTSCRVILYLMN